jgi:hypothetical protein
MSSTSQVFLGIFKKAAIGATAGFTGGFTLYLGLTAQTIDSSADPYIFNEKCSTLRSTIPLASEDCWDYKKGMEAGFSMLPTIGMFVGMAYGFIQGIKSEIFDKEQNILNSSSLPAPQ